MASDKKCEGNHRVPYLEKMHASMVADDIITVTNGVAAAVGIAVEKGRQKEAQKREQIRRAGGDPNSVVSVDLIGSIIAGIIILVALLLFAR